VIDWRGVRAVAVVVVGVGWGGGGDCAQILLDASAERASVCECSARPFTQPWAVRSVNNAASAPYGRIVACKKGYQSCL
jgi:hypothetical protein